MASPARPSDAARQQQQQQPEQQLLFVDEKGERIQVRPGSTLRCCGHAQRLCSYGRRGGEDRGEAGEPLVVLVVVVAPACACVCALRARRAERGGSGGRASCLHSPPPRHPEYLSASFAPAGDDG